MSLRPVVLAGNTLPVAGSYKILGFCVDWDIVFVMKPEISWLMSYCKIAWHLILIIIPCYDWASEMNTYLLSGIDKIMFYYLFHFDFFSVSPSFLF